MASIVLGLGTSHSPQASVPAAQWHLSADRDRGYPGVDYDRLLVERQGTLDDQLTLETFERKDAACQRAIATLARELAAAESDVVLVVGDDQDEFFLDDQRPTVAIYWGEELVDLPVRPETMHPSIRSSMWARHGEVAEIYPGHAELGRWLVSSLVEQGFDITQVRDQPPGRTLGHAFTFVRRRLMGTRPIPMVPILLNTYYPPNQPSARRCYELGEALRAAIECFPGGERVAVVGSGGLSHFVIDEAFDRDLLSWLAARDLYRISSIPRERLQSGTSECSNWIAAAGALRGLNMHLVDYIPGYRSPAGTGCGLAFAVWLPSSLATPLVRSTRNHVETPPETGLHDDHRTGRRLDPNQA